MTQAAVIGLVMEAIQKTESLRMGRADLRSASPNASMPRMPSGPTTTVTAPENSLDSSWSESAKAITAFCSSKLTLAAGRLSLSPQPTRKENAESPQMSEARQFMTVS